MLASLLLMASLLLLTLLLLLASLIVPPAVASSPLVPDVLTVAGLPDFDGVKLAFLLLLSFLLLLAFLLLLFFPAVSSVTGVLRLMTSLLLLACRFWRPYVIVVGILTYWTESRHTRLLVYRTQWYTVIFSAIENIRISNIGLANSSNYRSIGSRPQSQSRQSAKRFSSHWNWDSPHPFSSRRVCPPTLWSGGRAHPFAAKGVGESQFQRGDIHWAPQCMSPLYI